MADEIDQEKLNQLVASHNKYQKGVGGHRRFNVSFETIDRLDLSGVELTDSVFVGCSAVGTKFRGAMLTSADMFGADFSGADLRKCDMTRADLRGIKLRGANLEDAVLVSADIRDGFIIRKKKSGEYDYSDRNSNNAIIADAKLAGADLSKAKLGRVFGPRTDLTNAKRWLLTRTSLHVGEVNEDSLSSFRTQVVHARFIFDRTKVSAQQAVEFTRLSPLPLGSTVGARDVG